MGAACFDAFGAPAFDGEWFDFGEGRVEEVGEGYFQARYGAFVGLEVCLGPFGVMLVNELSEEEGLLRSAGGAWVGAFGDIGEDEFGLLAGLCRR